MRVRDTRFIEHTGTMTPQRVQAMEFDQNSIQHLMTVLTDLYSDQALAVIREYSTNALDSHRAAGNTEPIEVELPSQMKPVFVVRDHGLGMSVDDITDHFSKYGWSSKRETDDEVGMLGLGCKSGLTYTNQFTLVAVKNGVKTTALITRNEEGVGVVQIMDTIGTNERNGVEIQVPAKAPIDQFTAKAEKFFSFWEPGTVLVNNQPPKSRFDPENDDNLFIDPDIIVVKTAGSYNYQTRSYDGIDSDYIVMGNVAYPCEIATGLKTHVIARVGIGEVNFVPSREALQMTTRTVDAIAQVKQFVQERLELHIQREIDACDSKAEAIKVAIRWDNIVHSYRNRPSYRGDVLPANLDMVGQAWTMGSYRGSASNISYLPCKDLVQENCYVMLGHPPRSMTKETKAEIRKAYPSATMVYVVHQMKREFRAWLDAGQIFQFDDVRPAKQPRVKGQRAGNHRYLDGGGRWLAWTSGVKFETVDIDADSDERLIYCLKTDSGYHENTRDEYRKKIGEFLAGLGTPFKFILLSAGEKERFCKLNPGAVHANDWFQQHADSIVGQLTEDQVWWGLRHDWRTLLADEDILDADAAALYARMKACRSDEAQQLNKELESVVRTAPGISGCGLIQLRGESLAEGRQKSTSDLPDKLRENVTNYPLLSERNRPASVEYMNAVYLYRKGECT